MIEVRITQADMWEMTPPFVEIQVAALLGRRGIKFSRLTYSPVPEDMEPPWQWWKDSCSGDLVVRQGDV